MYLQDIGNSLFGVHALAMCFLECLGSTHRVGGACALLQSCTTHAHVPFSHFQIELLCAPCLGVLVLLGLMAQRGSSTRVVEQATNQINQLPPTPPLALPASLSRQPLPPAPAASLSRQPFPPSPAASFSRQPLLPAPAASPCRLLLPPAYPASPCRQSLPPAPPASPCRRPLLPAPADSPCRQESMVCCCWKLVDAMLTVVHACVTCFKMCPSCDCE